MKPTGETYMIRTVDDFRKVPEGRRAACLREFGTYLKISDPLSALIGVPTELKHFEWKDDGIRHLSLEIRSNPETEAK